MSVMIYDYCRMVITVSTTVNHTVNAGFSVNFYNIYLSMSAHFMKKIHWFLLQSLKNIMIHFLNSQFRNCITNTYI